MYEFNPDDNSGSYLTTIYLAEPPTPTLNTLRRAKHPYSSPMGYASSNRCSDIRRTATNMVDAAYVHHKMDNVESM